MDKSEKQHITLGGVDFSYSKRRSYQRCAYVCGGLTGLHSSGKWSTWSPGRFPIPEADDDFGPAFQKALASYRMWPKIEGGHYYFLIDAKIRTTCAHCQFICCPDKKERKRRFKMLTQSGVVVQNSNGALEAVSPEEAKERLSNMSHEIRMLYEEEA
jgi:epoxyqueuosine reductase QueG